MYLLSFSVPVRLESVQSVPNLLAAVSYFFLFSALLLFVRILKNRVRKNGKQQTFWKTTLGVSQVTNITGENSLRNTVGSIFSRCCCLQDKFYQAKNLQQMLKIIFDVFLLYFLQKCKFS